MNKTYNQQNGQRYDWLMANLQRDNLHGVLKALPVRIETLIDALDNLPDISKDECLQLTRLSKYLDSIGCQRNSTFFDKVSIGYRFARQIVSDLAINLSKRPIADKKSFLYYKYQEEMYRLELIRMGGIPN